MGAGAEKGSTLLHVVLGRMNASKKSADADAPEKGGEWTTDATDILTAIKEDDPERLAAALQMFFELCSKEETGEPPDSKE